MLPNRRIVYVNDVNAVNTGRTPQLYVGEVVRVAGRTSNGTLYANMISPANGNGYGQG